MEAVAAAPAGRLERATPTATWWSRPPIAVGVIAVVVVVVFLAGTWTGRHRAETGAWHSGRAQVGLREVSIEFHGWTYGAIGSVPTWRDRAGTWRDGGWPSCLRPVGHTLDVRFQARTVTVDGSTWRPIVAIDCQGIDAS